MIHGHFRNLFRLDARGVISGLIAATAISFGHVSETVADDVTPVAKASRFVPEIRTYRVPFDSVTRMFPPGTDLESIRFEDFIKILDPVFSKSFDASDSLKFDGSVDHDLELQGNTLLGVSRFVSPSDETKRQSLRKVPGWLDAEFLLRSGWKSSGPDLHIDSDGELSLDFVTNETVVRWGVPSLDTGGDLRFPVRFPPGLVSRIRLHSNRLGIPSSDVGVWMPASDFDATSPRRSWVHSGFATPTWIRIAERPEIATKTTEDFDGDSLTEWSINDDIWAGSFAATLRSSSAIETFKAKVPADVIVTACQVNGEDTRFQRVENALIVPVDASPGCLVTVRIEMKRPATREREAELPTLQPLSGRWFLVRASVLDSRKAPFVEAVDASGKLIPVTIESPPANGSGPTRLRFALSAPGANVKLRSSTLQRQQEEDFSGEYLLREKAAFASLRIALMRFDPLSEGRLRIETKMRPIRIESYRTSGVSAKTPCDFETEPFEGGFSVSALPSDPARGTLHFDILLSQNFDETEATGPIRLPKVSFASGRFLNSKWSILSEDPNLRLNVRTSSSTRWLPNTAGDAQAKLPGIQEIAPTAKPLATWWSEGDAAPELVPDHVRFRSANAGGKSMIVLIADRENRSVHSIRFENGVSKKPGFRVLTNEALSRAMTGRFAESRIQRNPKDPELSSPWNYEYETYSSLELEQKMKEVSADGGTSSTGILLVYEKSPQLDKLFSQSRIADAENRGEEAVAAASIDFLKANRWLPNRFGHSGRTRVSIIGPAKLAGLAERFSSEIAANGSSTSSEQIASGPVTLKSEIAADGSANHSLLTKLSNPMEAEIRIVPKEGCVIVSARIDDASLPLEMNESGRITGVILDKKEGPGAFELKFSTEAGILESGFPIEIPFADVLTTWMILSDGNRWSLDVQPDGSRPFRTTFGELRKLRIVRKSPESSATNVSNFAIAIVLWSMIAFLFRRYSNRIFRSPIPFCVFTAVTFTAAFLPGTPALSVFAGTLACIFSIVVSKRSASLPWIRTGFLAFLTIALAPECVAQVGSIDPIVRVAIPYDKIENAFEQPRRAILARSDLRKLRELADESGRGPIVSKLFSTEAKHTIQPVEGDSLQIVSKYKVSLGTSTTPSNPERPIVVPLASDDAIQVRASLDGIDLPVRVDRASGIVELQFDKFPAGELTIQKTFLTPRAGAGSKIRIFPAIGSSITNATSANGASGLRAQVRIGKRNGTIEPGTEMRFDLADELMLLFSNSNSAEAETNDIRTWFTTVRSSIGYVVIVRLNDDSMVARSLAFSDSVRFLDASDCDVTILSKEAGGKSRIRVVPLQKSIRIRFWIPQNETDIAFGKILEISPPLPSSKSIIRIAAGSDVVGDWSILSDSRRIDEDPFELESANSEAEATIDASFEVSDWSTAHLRFADRKSEPKPEIEGKLRLEDDEILGSFDIRISAPEGSSIVRHAIVSFDPGTIVTAVTGADLIGEMAAAGNTNARDIEFRAGSDGVARFEIRTRTKVHPSRVGEPSSPESRSPVPWPRFGSNSLEAGKLIVERRIDPDSTFRSSPMRLENAPIESRGEIRTPETPANLRHWLYSFRGSAEPPLVSWQLPGVFSHVQVEHEIDVVGDIPRWQCRMNYTPMDGPLSTILFEIEHDSDFEPIVEPDDPEFWKVDQFPETGKTRFRLRSNTPHFGRSTLRIREGSVARRKNRFSLPDVTPLGHGKVDKSVMLRSRTSPSVSSFEVESRGLVESQPPHSVSNEIGTFRSWRFRSTDASLSLRFGNATGGSDPVQKTPPPENLARIRNLAFEFTDDGNVLWYATIDSAQLFDEGLPFADSMGTIQVSGSANQPLQVDRKEGKVSISGQESQHFDSEVTLAGRFGVDRLPDFFRTIQGHPPGISSKGIVFAMRHGDRSPEAAPGTKAQLIEWITSGTPEEGSRVSEGAARDRIRRFQQSDFASSNENLAESRNEPASVSKSGQDIESVPVRFSSLAIDQRLLSEPGRWNFFRYDPGRLAQFLKDLREDDSNRTNRESRLSRGLIAMAMTIAFLTFGRARSVRDRENA